MYKVCVFILLACFVKKIEEKEIPLKTPGDDYRLYEELKIDKVIGFPAFREALKGYGKYGSGKNPVLALIDFTKPSSEKRFCVVDLKQKRVLFQSHVAHGKNSGENYAVSFSNRPGSFQSSLGFFRTGKTYYGKNGYSLTLTGLEKGLNDKARERGIVIHGAKYADPALANRQGRLGRSLGCPALPLSLHKEIIDSIKEGALLYIYGKDAETKSGFSAPYS